MRTSQKKPPEDWARSLGELLPAIGLCLGNEETRAKWIAKAGPAGNGMAAVRVIQASDRAVDCEADLSGKGTAKVAAVNASDPPLRGRGKSAVLPGA